MFFFIKAFLSFISTYLNSWNFKNKLSSFLRLLFERNNKFSQSITNLGNVFRSSKWSDLKIVNISQSLTSNFKKILIPTAFLFLLSGVLGWDYLDTLWGSFWVSYALFLDWLGDLFFLAGLKIFTLKVYFNFKLNSFEKEIINMSGGGSDSSSSSNHNSSQNLVSTGNTFADSTNRALDLGELIDLSNHSDLLNNFSQSLRNYENLNITNSPTHNNLYASLVASNNPTNNKFLLPLGVGKGRTTFSIHGVLGSESHKLLTLNELSTAGVYGGESRNQNYYYFLTQSVIDSNLDSKQVRWLSKNTMVDYRLSTDSNLYLTSKMFLNFNKGSWVNASSNIWQSNLYSTGGINILLDGYRGVSTGYTSNYNAFEEARDFFNKRLILVSPQNNLSTNYLYNTYNPGSRFGNTNPSPSTTSVVNCGDLLSPKDFNIDILNPLHNLHLGEGLRGYAVSVKPYQRVDFTPTPLFICVNSSPTLRTSAGLVNTVR